MAKGHTKRKMRKGFTLIELLVSIVIFVIFMGIVSSSYVNIVRAQKDANEIRRMYSEVRNFVDSLSAEAKLGTIDYGCYGGTIDVYSTVCPQMLQVIINGRTTDLALVRKDGLEKTIFRYDPDLKKVQVVKYEPSPGGAWALAAGYDGFRDIMGDSVKVDKLSFAISPDVNPYSQENAYKSEKQFQPEVTVYMSVSNGENIKSQFSLDFQTTISSRVYSRS